jgi:O-antigen/teichoic acid export membrane protein
MLISFNGNIPRYFIEGHLGIHQLGIFAAITALQKAAPTVVQALGRSASPRLAKYYAANNIRAFRRLTLQLAGIGALLGGAGVLVALVAGRPILTLLYGAEYALPGLFALVMVDAGLDYISTMLLFVITSARYLRIQLPLYMLTTCTVALACFLLIPAYGLQGAAVAVIISELVRLAGSLAAVWHALRSLGSHATASELQTPDYAPQRVS